jgi:hypothetical protein
MHNIGVGGDFVDLKWTFLNRPISKLKYIKNLPLANNLQKNSCTQKYGHLCFEKGIKMIYHM